MIRALYMNGEMKLLIHGTKNAYTTLRTNDLIRYSLDLEVEGCSQRLGVYDGNLIHPLCAKLESDPSIMVIDPVEEALPAETLKKTGRLLNIVSSDRRGANYLVEEFIDSSVYIPLFTKVAERSVTTSSGYADDTNTEMSRGDDEDIDLEIARLKLKIAQLELRSLMLKRSKE